MAPTRKAGFPRPFRFYRVSARSIEIVLRADRQIGRVCRHPKGINRSAKGLFCNGVAAEPECQDENRNDTNVQKCGAHRRPPRFGESICSRCCNPSACAEMRCVGHHKIALLSGNLMTSSTMPL